MSISCILICFNPSQDNDQSNFQDQLGRLGLGPGPSEGEDQRSGRTALDDMDMSNMDVGFVPKRETSSLSLTASGLSGDSSDYVECSAASTLFQTPGGDSSLGSGSVDSITFAQARDSAILRYKEKKKIRRCAKIFCAF